MGFTGVAVMGKLGRRLLLGKVAEEKHVNCISNYIGSGGCYILVFKTIGTLCLSLALTKDQNCSGFCLQFNARLCK